MNGPEDGIRQRRATWKNLLGRSDRLSASCPGKQGGRALVLAVLLAGTAHAQQTPGGSDSNTINDPTAPLPSVLLQNYYNPSLTDRPGRSSNQTYIYSAIPYKISGHPQIFRASVPVFLTPTMPRNSNLGLSDIQLLNWTMFKVKGVGMVGVGPLIVLPTATSKVSGQGKWSTGATAIVISSHKWGLIGGILIDQHSFASVDNDRPHVNTLTFQPLIIYNLPAKFYLRSTGIMSFQFATNTDTIPIGFGIGKIVSSGSTNLNFYVEPQVSAWSRGPNVPRYRILFGLTVQFKKQHPS